MEEEGEPEFFRDVIERLKNANASLEGSYVKELPDYKPGRDTEDEEDKTDFKVDNTDFKAGAEDLTEFWKEMHIAESRNDAIRGARDAERRKLQQAMIIQDRLERGSKAEAKVFELQQLLREQEVQIEALRLERERGWDGIVDDLLEGKVGRKTNGLNSSVDYFQKKLKEERQAVTDLVLAVQRGGDSCESKDGLDLELPATGERTIVQAAAAQAQDLAAEKCRTLALEEQVANLTEKLNALELEKDSYRMAAVALAKERETSEYWRKRCDDLEEQATRVYRDINGLGSLVGVETPVSPDAVVRKPRVWRYPEPTRESTNYHAHLASPSKSD